MTPLDFNKIPLEDLSDREIMLYTAQQVNAMTTFIEDHETRLRWLERLANGLVGAWVFLTEWLGVHIWTGK
jgi:hypothetical protein